MRAKLATLHELQTIYNLEDLYDLLELAAVDSYNRGVLQKHEAKRAQET